MPVTKEKKLTFRERKFLKYLGQGLDKGEAAIKAGYSAKSAGSLAYQTLQKPLVKTAFQNMLHNHGVTDEKLATVIREGLDANKVISANIIAPSGAEMADANSMTKDFVDVHDWLARHKFCDTALKLTSKYPNEKVEHEVQGNLDHRVLVKFIVEE